MNGLLNFLQAASNTAADTVAGPVDLFSFLLNKAGVPVTEPVGGSEWMRKKGLKKDVPQNAASLAGETVGLLSPVAVAANAPKIARGLIQGAENLAAPATLNKQAGAVVWHGTKTKEAAEDIMRNGLKRGGDVKDNIGTLSPDAASVATDPRLAGRYGNWVVEFDMPDNLRFLNQDEAIAALRSISKPGEFLPPTMENLKKVGPIDGRTYSYAYDWSDWKEILEHQLFDPTVLKPRGLLYRP